MMGGEWTVTINGGREENSHIKFEGEE